MSEASLARAGERGAKLRGAEAHFAGPDLDRRACSQARRLPASSEKTEFLTNFSLCYFFFVCNSVGIGQNFQNELSMERHLCERCCVSTNQEGKYECSIWNENDPRSR